MKPRIRNAMLVAGSCVLAGLAAVFAAFAICGFQPEKLFVDGTWTRQTVLAGTSPAALRSVAVEAGPASVVVRGVEDETFSIEYPEREEKRLYAFTEQDRTLEFYQATRPWYEYILNFDALAQRQITVNVPKSFRGDLRIDTDNRKIEIQGLQSAGSISCETHNGWIVLSDIEKAGTVYCITDNGGIELQDVARAGEIICYTSNGPIRLQNIGTAQSIDMQNGNGQISLEQATVSGKVTALTSNNFIDMDHVDAGALELRTSNGDIAGALTGRRSEYFVTGSARNGKSSLTPDQGDPANKKQLAVETTNGDVAVSFLADETT